jgi:CheY-like chemotaxis protein
VGLTDVHLSDRESKAHGYLDPGDYLKLSVSDTGNGIPSEILDSIFEPFFTTNQVGTGTGMGLAVVFGIVQAHNGNILVESVPGKGTTFQILIPETNETAQDENYSESLDEPKGGNERVLFVDDEENMIEIIGEMLGHLGYRVTTFSDSPSALRAFERYPDSFDLIISDQTMPIMTGLELSERILQVRPQLPIIICTGYSKKLEDENAYQRQGISVLMKPFKHTEIAQKIREVLDRK